jgi:hypothetical protein
VLCSVISCQFTFQINHIKQIQPLKKIFHFPEYVEIYLCGSQQRFQMFQQLLHILTFQLLKKFQSKNPVSNNQASNLELLEDYNQHLRKPVQVQAMTNFGDTQSES